MEFLVEFTMNVPKGTPDAEIVQRDRAEAAAAAELVAKGQLLRLWRVRGASGVPTAIGLYAADSQTQLDGVLAALPLAEWMSVAVTPLEPHPNDPAPALR